MTATDELRRMLDERGAEWHRTPHYSSESIDNETVFRGEGIDWIANDHLNGHIGLRALRYEVTPEQAIAATLGSGTCQLKQASWDDGTCTWGCICTACDAHLEHETGYGYNFCPICGAKVVTE